MKKLFFPIVILLAFVCNSFAQVDYQINSALDFYHANKAATGDFKQILTEADIEGSPYLNEEFVAGTIYTTSKLQYVDVPLRYNIFNQSLEFRTNTNKIMAMSTPEVIERVTIGEYDMVYSPYASQKKMKRSFFKILSEGKISLYAKPEILYKEAEEPGAYKEAEPAQFVSKPDTYYLRNGKNEAIRVDKKSQVIDFFPDHNDEVAAYIKKNKIKTSKESGLLKVVEYYNTNF